MPDNEEPINRRFK